MIFNNNISIIIVSYNVKDYLSKCIDSIQKSYSNAEIIVVDNNSKDGSCEMLKNKFPFVKLIINTENKGFSGANNQGIIVAQSENILLLNPDTEVTSDALNKMISIFETQETPCIVGPKLLNSDGTLQISCWKFIGIIDIFLETFYLHKIISFRKYSKDKMKNTFETDALSGAALLFKKELVNKIGLMDENLFWMEDVDLCYRNKKSGGINIYYPEAVIIHNSGQSANKNYRITISNQLISKLKFFKKYKKYFSFFFSALFIFIHIISRIIIFGLLSLFSEMMRNKCDAYTFTFIKFFKFIFTGYKSIT